MTPDELEDLLVEDDADRARREAPPPQVDLRLLAGAVSGTPLPMVH